MPDIASTISSDEPLTRRVRHDLVRRRLTVSAVEKQAPSMVRLLLTGDELVGFVSAGADDHVKLFFDEGMRDFTPRYYDAECNVLAIDFVLHEGGPAGDFAARAKVGDTLNIGGPRGSLVVSERVKRWLLVADDPAIPALARRLGEFDAGMTVQAVIAVTVPEEEQPQASKADVSVTWVHRPTSASDDAAPILDALRALHLRSETFVWVAAEASVAKAVRQHLLDERQHPRIWLKAAGYWIKGAEGAHQPLDD